MAVIINTPEGLVLTETAPGVTVADVVAATGTPLIIANDVKIMNIEVTA
jgi:acyl CoA:acetate/3-ketoacid CoA transferase beta subunit